MKLQKATLKDLKACAEIFRIESAKAPYNKKRTPEKALNQIKKDFKGNDIYVAVINDKIVGFVMVQRDSGIKNQLWINELWVLKEYQGQGIGKNIMNKVEEIYKKKGITIFKLAADTRKGGACDFYKKLRYNIDKGMVFMEKKIYLTPINS